MLNCVSFITLANIEKFKDLQFILLEHKIINNDNPFGASRVLKIKIHNISFILIRLSIV